MLLHSGNLRCCEFGGRSFILTVNYADVADYVVALGNVDELNALCYTARQTDSVDVHTQGVARLVDNHQITVVVYGAYGDEFSSLLRYVDGLHTLGSARGLTIDVVAFLVSQETTFTVPKGTEPLFGDLPFPCVIRTGDDDTAVLEIGKDYGNA